MRLKVKYLPVLFLAVLLWAPAHAQSWVTFPDMIPESQKFQEKEKIFVCLASGPMVHKEDDLGVSSELGALFHFSDYFAFSLSGQWNYSHHTETESYGDHERMYSSLSLRFGLRYFPTGLGRSTLSFGVSFGPGIMRGFERDIFYTDSGPKYSYKLREVRWERPLQGKKSAPDYAFTVEYRYFISKKLALGVNFQNSTYYMFSARLAVTRSF